VRRPGGARAGRYAANLAAVALGALLGAWGAMWLLWRREDRQRPPARASTTWGAAGVRIVGREYLEAPIFPDPYVHRLVDYSRIPAEVRERIGPDADPLDVPAIWRRR